MYYIFYANFNNKCPITIIFGVVSSHSMRHRKMVSFSTYLVNYLIWEITEHKNDQFRRKQHNVLWIASLEQKWNYNVALRGEPH